MQAQLSKNLFSHSTSSKQQSRQRETNARRDPWRALRRFALLLTLPAATFASSATLLFKNAADAAIAGLGSVRTLINTGPVNDPNFRGSVASLVESAQEKLEESIAKLPPDISAYPEFMEFCGREKLNYGTPPSNTKIFINQSRISGVSLSGVQHLYYVGNWNPTGFSLPTSLLSLGFFDGPSTGLNASQRTQISNLARETKVLQNLIVMNWGDSTIAKNAFKDGTSLLKVIIHKATTAGNYAFYVCSALTTVSLPNVTEIGMWQFGRCIALTTVSLPALIILNDGGFYGCSALLTISLPKATRIGRPNNDHGAFECCLKLVTALLPSATTLTKAAFAGCPPLQETLFPNVTTIACRAFEDCTSLKAVIYKSGGFVDSSSFNGCTAQRTTI
ncbi:MAG: leucine-rich repeat domain-containing protein [Holosporales bacterium]|jgi:hypothetical protein|nr:leucine-rich repeat domain-containing protein [Holosporales bacterium]